MTRFVRWARLRICLAFGHRWGAWRYWEMSWLGRQENSDYWIHQCSRCKRQEYRTVPRPAKGGAVL